MCVKWQAAFFLLKREAIENSGIYTYLSFVVEMTEVTRSIVCRAAERTKGTELWVVGDAVRVVRAEVFFSSLLDRRMLR